MHFVKKVATTEEQKLRKEKERAEKLKIYCKLRDRILKKRIQGDLDEEMLSITASVLEKSPNVYTFWNARRETINSILQKSLEESDEENKIRKDRRLRSEMLLTESCLKTNSKSYCAWFHRFWCFKQLSNPNIAEELAACEKFLKLDDRNFHCWDYRRQIAQFGAHSLEEEFKFSERLINANFSNYSAWHYRSSLLPSLFPDIEKQLSMSQQALYNEYQKLQNAFFTDPEDQSAWIYAEWLLLSSENKMKYNIANIHLLGLIFDFTTRKVDEATVSCLSITFDRAVKLSRISDFVVIKMMNADQWNPITSCVMTVHRAFGASKSYRFEIDGEIAECQLRPSLGEPYQIIDMERGYVNFDEIYHIYHIKCKPISEARRHIIEKLMDNCQELLKELKVESKNEILKWPLLTYTFAIMELEPIKMFSMILANLEELATNIDPQRHEMYEEIAVNLRINEKLREKLDDVQRIDILFNKVDGHFIGELKLDNLGLKSIDHLKYLSSFITRLDLTGNKLTNLYHFKPFRRLTYLKLLGNPITSCKNVSMLPQLDYLGIPEINVNNLDGEDSSALRKIRSLEFGGPEKSVKV